MRLSSYTDIVIDGRRLARRCATVSTAETARLQRDEGQSHLEAGRATCSAEDRIGRRRRVRWRSRAQFPRLH